MVEILMCVALIAVSIFALVAAAVLYHMEFNDRKGVEE